MPNTQPYETNQIYEIANDIANQVMGTTALKAVDTNSFVALGQQILASDNYTENFNNTLVLRIARTIVAFREYTMLLKPLVFGELEWGALIQKTKTEMPTAEADKAYDLEDGKSVDMYVVKKPKYHQKFFYNRTPYSFFVTIQRWQLKRAFISETAFAAFVASIFGEIRNKLELTFEALGYSTMANFIGNIAGTSQEIHLVTMYNNATGKSLTPANAMLDNDFIRFAVKTINIYRKRLAAMSTIYNAENYERHTPTAMQRFVILSDYMESIKTVVLWEAFNREYVSVATTMEIPYWQSLQSPTALQVTKKDGTEVSLDGVFAFIHDREALGVYRKEDEVITTPLNARGRYTNTFWHEEQMWFNDLSENGLVFTLS